MVARTLAALAVVAVAAVLIVTLMPGPAATPSPSATASPTASPAASPSPTPTASPAATPSPSPSPTGGRFVNAALGYSIDLTPPWRHSSCFSSSVIGPSPDIFVPVAEYDEEQGHTGLRHDYILVLGQPNPERLTPRQWWDTGRAIPNPGGTLRDITFAGRPALKIDGDAEGYIVTNETHMFERRAEPKHGEPTKPQQSAILATFRFLTAAELAAARAAPTPTPPAARSPEEVARLLADGFGRKDVALLATLVGRSCLAISIAEGGRSQINAQRYLDELRARFSRGLTVAVRPNEFENAPGLDNPTRLVESTWQEPGQPDLEADLMIAPKTDDHWYWSGVVLRFIGR